MGDRLGTPSGAASFSSSSLRPRAAKQIHGFLEVFYVQSDYGKISPLFPMFRSLYPMKRFACSVFSHTTSIRMPLLVCHALSLVNFSSMRASSQIRPLPLLVSRVQPSSNYSRHCALIFLLILLSLSSRLTSAPRSEIHSTTRLAGKHLKHLQLCVWRSLVEHIAQRNSRATLQPASTARLAQSVERKALNLVVVGSSPTVGVVSWHCRAS